MSDLQAELKQLIDQREQAKVLYFKYMGAVEVLESLIDKEKNSIIPEKPVAKKIKK